MRSGGFSRSHYWFVCPPPGCRANPCLILEVVERRVLVRPMPLRPTPTRQRRTFDSEEHVRQTWVHNFPRRGLLFYRYWTPAGIADPKDVVLVLHGIGLHSGVYKSTATQLNKAGIAVYAVDTRGHDCRAANVETFRAATKPATLPACWNDPAKISHAELFLMAKAWDDFRAELRERKLSGYFRTDSFVACVWGESAQYEQFKMWLYLPDLLFLRDKPDIDLQGRGTSHEKRSVEPTVPQAPDPLIYDKISVNYILELRRNRAHWTDAAPQVRSRRW